MELGADATKRPARDYQHILSVTCYALVSAYSLLYGLFAFRAFVLACLYPLCKKLKPIAAFAFVALLANTVLEIERANSTGTLSAIVYYVRNREYPVHARGGEHAKSSSVASAIYSFARDIRRTDAPAAISPPELTDVFWLC